MFCLVARGVATNPTCERRPGVFAEGRLGVDVAEPLADRPRREAGEDMMSTET